MQLHRIVSFSSHTVSTTIDRIERFFSLMEIGDFPVLLTEISLNNHNFLYIILEYLHDNGKNLCPFVSFTANIHSTPIDINDAVLFIIVFRGAVL